MQFMREMQLLDQDEVAFGEASLTIEIKPNVDDPDGYEIEPTELRLAGVTLWASGQSNPLKPLANAMCKRFIGSAVGQSLVEDVLATSDDFVNLRQADADDLRGLRHLHRRSVI